jgi:hypothetical protein
MVASTSLNASIELVRAIAFMHGIVRTGPGIASSLDDQRYALGERMPRSPSGMTSRPI